MKKFINYSIFFIVFLSFFFIKVDAAYASNFAGVKVTIKNESGTLLNNIATGLRADTPASYTGGGSSRSCDSDNTTSPGPFVNLNGTDTYYARLFWFSTGATYTYGGQTYNNPNGVVYFGNGVNSTNTGGGMGFGFACSCNPLKIVIRVPSGYFYDRDNDNIIDANETGDVTISKTGLANDSLYSYIFTLKDNDPPTATNVSHDGNTTNGYTFPAGTTPVQLLGKGVDPEDNQIQVKSKNRWKVTGAADTTYSTWAEATYSALQTDNAGRNLQNVTTSNGRTYQWQMRTKDINGAESAWTSSWTFSVAAPTVTTYTLTTSVFPAGFGSVSGNSSPYSAGATATIKANPASADYSFSSWSGDCGGSVNPLSLTMNGNKLCTANFSFLPPPPPSCDSVDAAPSTGTLPLLVKFTAKYTNLAPTSFEWDFNGDGIIDRTTTINTTTNTYASTGTFNVSVKINYSLGSCTSTVTITTNPWSSSDQNEVAP